MLAFAWSRFRSGYQKPPWMRTFLWIQAFDLVQGAIAIAMAYLGRNNQWLRHLTGPVVFAGMLWTLFLLAPDSRGRRGVYGACLAAGLVAALAGAQLDGMRWRNSIFTSTMSVVYLGLVTWELRTLMQTSEDVELTSLPTFWMLAALLVYSTGSLIFNASSNYFLRTLPASLLLIPWAVVGIIHALQEIMFAKVFLCPKPTSS